MNDAAPAVAPPRSLLVRTTAVLALAFIVFFGALALVVGPFLANSFEKDSAELRRDGLARTRETARMTDTVTEKVLVAAVDHAQATAAAVVDDAPIETAAGDPAKIRAMLAERLSRAWAPTKDNLDALADELRAQTQERLDGDEREAASRSAAKAREFGHDLGTRAAAAMLGLTAVLFLIHGALLWRSVIAPVSRLADATREVAKGRLAVRLPVRGNDEVAHLAASFNAMTESLGRAQGELVALNATLEDRVREKSAALVQAERELRHAEKMASLGTLAGGVAHEFNNLLGGIQGCAEDAARETDPAEVRETLGVIERTARRGAAITEKLLRFARPSALSTSMRPPCAWTMP